MDIRDSFSQLCSASEPSGPPQLWSCRLTPGAALSSGGTRLFSPAAPSRPDGSRPRPPAEPAWPFCSPPLTLSPCASSSSHCKNKGWNYLQSPQTLLNFSPLFLFIYCCYIWVQLYYFPSLLFPFLFSFFLNFHRAKTFSANSPVFVKWDVKSLRYLLSGMKMKISHLTLMEIQKQAECSPGKATS